MKKSRLAIKFIVPVSVLIILISILLTTLITQVARNSLEIALQQRVKSLASNLVYNSELGVLTGNQQTLQKLISGVLSQEDILYVVIVDEKDNLLVQSEKEDFLGVIEESQKALTTLKTNTNTIHYFSLPKYKIELYELTTPIITIKKQRTAEEISLDPLLAFSDPEEPSSDGQEKTIGFVKMGVSTTNISNTVNQFISTITIISLISVLLITLIVGITISKIVILPIKKLVYSMDKVARGDFSSQIKIISNDEIGQMASSFNSMAISLKEAYEKLETNITALKTEITERERIETILAKQKEELLRSNSELEQFAYVASHDLQEPLRKIQAFGDRLKNKFANVISEEGRDYLERMQNASKRMQTLINDLLAFSRITTKTQPFVKLDLNKLTQEVLSDLEALVERTKGQVEIKDLPEIEADPLQMRQLFQNLINNALKFHRKDITPIVKIYAQITKENNNSNKTSFNTYNIFVEDNGIGFEEKYLDRIFVIFQRLHGRSEYEGTGIGLAICRKIAERHQGSITAKSKLEEGTTFIVTLPSKQH